MFFDKWGPFAWTQLSATLSDYSMATGMDKQQNMKPPSLVALEVR
jgi:hypothetical protein